MELRLLFAAVLVAALTPPRAQATQSPLLTRPAQSQTVLAAAKEPKLKGKFLHITDIHPDPYYKVYSSTRDGDACHRGSGPAGVYGAETSDCDSPLALVNATFKWIEDNLKDEIDFIIWTGDSARHDNDEHFPRSEKQVIGQNQLLVQKFLDVFGVDKKSHRPRRPRPQPDLRIPIIPSFGNNDILPHNIFEEGPNHWTKLFAKVWRPFIPEEQRHGFDRGGWFFVEVIPNKLAVFSLNTMYVADLFQRGFPHARSSFIRLTSSRFFFDSNSAVDGCGSHKEPGFEHMEWLRIQLQFLRDRGMKAIMSGHVPPARNEEKVVWDETCWQKYALWMQQYRDVVVGSMYGHMNIEHFVLQDFKDIDLKVAAQGYDSEEALLDATNPLYVPASQQSRDDASILVKTQNYLIALRDQWSKLPSVPDDTDTDRSNGKDSPSSEEKYQESIGGEWAERFSLSLVTASVVPNFFSTIRVFEYNITGLEDVAPWHADFVQPAPAPWENGFFHGTEDGNHDSISSSSSLSAASAAQSELKRRSLRDLFRITKKKHKKPKFTVPLPPSSSAPPGPAYSPQPLSFTSYTQYIANNTWINHDLSSSSSPAPPPPSAPHRRRALHASGWDPGKHESERPGKHRKSPPSPRDFAFEKLYDTADERDAYGLAPRHGGLAMRRWVELASRIGKFRAGLEDDAGCSTDDDDDECGLPRADVQDAEVRDPHKGDNRDDDDNDNDNNDDADTQKHKKHKHKHKHKHKKTGKEKARKIVRAWYAFVSRAVTGTMNRAELRNEFGAARD